MAQAATRTTRSPRIFASSVATIALLALAVVAFWDWLKYDWAQWTKDYSPFGYGYLVPPTIAYLLWCKRKAIRAAAPSPGRAWVVLPIAFALVVQIVGMMSSFNLLQSVGFAIMILAIPYLVWGSEVFRVVWGPLAFSWTMIPWPDQVTSLVLLPSQLLSTKIAARMLETVGVSTTVEATYVYLPNYSFEVAKACSGLTILFPVAAIAILNCMMVVAPLWRKALVLLLAVPVSMISNALRIAIIGLIGNSGGAKLAETLHDSSGLFGVFIAIILLTLVQWVLKCLHYHPDYMPTFGAEAEVEGGKE